MLRTRVSPSLTSVARLADVARQDPDFIQVGELYRDDPAFDVQRLVAELVEAESVPLLPVFVTSLPGCASGGVGANMGLPAQEDAIDARTKLPESDPNGPDRGPGPSGEAPQVGDIPVPPKYTSADFLKSHCWRLRGKLDVPKDAG